MQGINKGWGNLLLPKPYLQIAKEQKFQLCVGSRRSYGDVCELAGGRVETMLTRNKFLSFDSVKAVVEVEAGMTIGEICQWALTKYLFPITVPGTQFPTIGGCIANDVHGKNHHQNGSFGNGVLEIKLKRDGQVLTCNSEQNPELFYATIGGLGLTGVVESAKIQLVTMPSPYVSVIKRKFKSLEEYFDLDEQLSGSYPYTVAWLDCAKTPQGSKSNYRGIYMAGQNTEVPRSLWFKHQQEVYKKPITFPFTLPFSLVNKITLRCFNELYYSLPRTQNATVTHYQKFFFPLDKFLLWNRVYGNRGFFQYQSLLPNESAKETLTAMLTLITNLGFGSPLMVLKKLGNKTSGGLLSYPKEGVTMAMDFVNQGERSLELLEKLDQLTINVGGRVNPSKDARMSPQTFARCYPQAKELEKLREKGRCSDFWLRVNEGKINLG